MGCGFRRDRFGRFGHDALTVRLIAIGRMKAGPERDLLDRYAARLRPRLDVTEIAETRGSALEIRRRDAASLLGACPDNALVVALDEGEPRRTVSNSPG